MLKRSVYIFYCALILVLFSSCGSSGGNNSSAEESNTPPSNYIEHATGTTDAAVSGSDAIISWTASGSFKISVFNSSNLLVDERNIHENSLKLENLEKNQEYTVLVEGTDDKSFTKTIYINTSEYQAQPSRIGAAALNNGAEVHWQALQEVLWYELYISEFENGNYSFAGKHTSTSAVIDGLRNGRTYFFRVIAVYKDKTEPYSNHNKNGYSRSSEQNVMGLLPGYSFGEVTAVTPGDAPDRHVKVFKGYLRGNEVRFIWDAVKNATSYVLLSSSSTDGEYADFAIINSNSYSLSLPVEKRFYKVAVNFNDEFRGPLSQLIEIKYVLHPVWDIKGGIESVTVNVSNLNQFKEAELYCMGDGESEWVQTKIIKNQFTAGWLEGGKHYSCKLKLNHVDMVYESDTKRVLVLPYPEVGDRLSIFVYEDNADLRWNGFDGDSSYDIFLQKDKNNIEAIASNITDLDFTFTNLSCGVNYTAYVKRNIAKGNSILTAPAYFTLDQMYCKDKKPSAPDYGMKRGEVIEWKSGLPKYGYYKSLTYNNKIYISFHKDLSGKDSPFQQLYEFDPAKDSWRVIDIDGKTAPTSRYLHSFAETDGKFYLYGSRAQGFNPDSSTWVYDPENDEWKEMNSIGKPPATHGGSMSASDGILYFFGGSISMNSANNSKELWVYNTRDINGKWKKISEAPYEFKTLTNTESVIINNNLYIFGGSTVDIGRGSSNNLWRYNIDDNTWKLLKPEHFSSVPGRFFFSAVKNDGKIYIFGGDNNNHNFLNDLWEYDPNNNDISPDGSWKRIKYGSVVPTPSRAQTAASAYGYIYMFSGYRSSADSLNSMHIYKP